MMMKKALLAARYLKVIDKLRYLDVKTENDEAVNMQLVNSW